MYDAILAHDGLQKAAGLFGGYGFTGTMQFFTETVHILWIIGLLTIIIETVGAVGLLVGFLGRVNALGTFAVMLGAMLTTHLPFGFSMNGFGNQQGEGYEMDPLIFGMSLALLVAGSGRYSIDRLLIGWPSNETKGSAFFNPPFCSSRPLLNQFSTNTVGGLSTGSQFCSEHKQRTA